MSVQLIRPDIRVELPARSPCMARLFRTDDFTTDIIENKSMKAADAKLVLHRWPYGLELRAAHGGLVLRPRQKARANWAKAFRRPRRSSDDLAAMRNLTNEFDRKEWKW
jgi:hypothetical protein